MMRAHYVQELESVRQNLVKMGETTLSLLVGALSRVADFSPVSRQEPVSLKPKPITSTDLSTTSV